MAKPFRLALYLATKARRDKPVDPSLGEVGRERLGHATVARPDGRLVWFHSGSDAQAPALKELAGRLLQERDDLVFLLTTSAGQRDPGTSMIQSQYCPDDALPSVRRFLDHWKPDVALWSETDLRPALIAEASARNIPLILADAQSSTHKKAAGTWPRKIKADLLGRFQAILAGDRKSAAELRDLGANASRIEVGGFLQEGSSPLPYIEAERNEMAELLGGRPTWLAAFVTPDELDAVILAHKRGERRSHRLLLILLPAEMSDAAAWLKRLQNDGYVVASRSHDDEPSSDVQIYLADVPGEMGLWYRLAPITFLGSSLNDGGGVNPYDAAALGSAIMHGMHTQKHAGAYGRLHHAGAAVAVTDGAALSEVLDAVLSPAKAAELAHNAWEVCSAGAAATDRITDLILTEIERL